MAQSKTAQSKSKSAAVSTAFARLIADGMQIGRTFVSYVNPDNGRPPITNLWTQLLGNRLISGSLVYIQGGQKQTVEIAAFTPARDLKTGKAEKGSVKKFRKAYTAGAMPDKTARGEFFRLLTYFILSAMTGELPSPNRVSGESTVKGAIALHWLESQGIEVVEAIATNPDTEESVKHSGESVRGILLAYRENLESVMQTWKRREAAVTEDELLDWEEAEL